MVRFVIGINSLNASLLYLESTVYTYFIELSHLFNTAGSYYYLNTGHDSTTLHKQCYKVAVGLHYTIVFTDSLVHTGSRPLHTPAS